MEIHNRWRFLKETQLRKSTGIASAIVGAALVGGQLYDFFVGQFSTEPERWVRARDILGLLPWYAWATIALLVIALLFFEGGYRTSRTRDQVVRRFQEDDVGAAMSALGQTPVSTYNGQRSSLLHIFSGLGDDLALGIPDLEILNEINQLIGRSIITTQPSVGTDARDVVADIGSGFRNVLEEYDFGNNAELKRLVACMLQAGVIQESPRLGTPDSQGNYWTLASLPVNVFHLTDLGRKIVTRLRDNVFK